MFGRTVFRCKWESRSVRFASAGLAAVAIVASSASAVAQEWLLSGNEVDVGGNYLGTNGSSSQPDLYVKTFGYRALLIDYVDATNGPNFVAGHEANGAAAGVKGAAIGGGGGTAAGNLVYDTFGVIGGGLDNAVGDGAGTVEDRPYATVSGGLTNWASGSYSVIGGGRSNEAAGSDSVVGGGRSNSASSGYSYQAIAGGYSNSAAGNYASIGGGYSNTVAGAGTVAGGYDNAAGGDYGVVGGGYTNQTSGWGSVVAGGSTNSAGSGWYAAVGGGASNDASGYAATVPGGLDNTAAGSYSFAAGRRARANQSGCFVWADSTNSDLSCDVTNRASLRSSGGVVWYTNSAMTTGVTLNAGGGSWSSVSDVDAKRDFEAVDAVAVLDLVETLPIAMWRYQDEDPTIRHMGPMAQDFRRAFGLGHSERHITTVDADGVALAAIQALRAENRELRAELERLAVRTERLGERLALASTDHSEVSWLAMAAACGIGLAVGRGRSRNGRS